LTPTKAGAVGALGALLSALIKRKLDRGRLWAVAVETGHITASILFLIVAATMYSRMLAMSGLPNDLGLWIAQADLGLYGVLTIYVFLLILDRHRLRYHVHHPGHGAPVHSRPFPVRCSTWPGSASSPSSELKLACWPPLGIACYVIQSTLADDRISLYDIFAGALPFAAIMFVVLILLIAFPWLSLVLV